MRRKLTGGNLTPWRHAFTGGNAVNQPEASCRAQARLTSRGLAGPVVPAGVRSGAFITGLLSCG